MGQKYTSISDLYKQVKLNEQEIIERKLTPQELEDREKIAKKLPMADFKKRYGKDAMAVKMATATNIVKKKSQEEETELDENIPKSTMYALVKDGKVIAKGSKRDMTSKMKKEGGKVFNAPSKKEITKTITEDAMQILQKLQTMSPEDALPTWWTNKLAVASNSMNKMRDYLLVPSVSESIELDEKAGDIPDLKKLVGELQNASKMHLAQSKRVKAHVDMMKGSKDLEPIVGELEKASQAH